MKYFQLIPLFLLSLFTFSCFSQIKDAAFEKMLQNLLQHNVEEIRVDSINNHASYIFLDARSREEYSISHIKDAVWIGYDEFTKDKIKEIPESAEIIVYCSVGVRSEAIAVKLQELGYGNVRNLYGGIFDWINKGRKVYQNGKHTEKIHPYNDVWGMWLQKGEKTTSP